MPKHYTQGKLDLTYTDDNNISISFVYGDRHTTDALKELARQVDFDYSPYDSKQWNTRVFGAKLIEAHGQGNSAKIGQCEIKKLDNDSIEVIRSFQINKEILKLFAQQLDGMDYTDTDSARKLGSKIIKYFDKYTK